MSKRLDRLGDQLDAIQRALEIAQRHPDPQQREHWLEVVQRAADGAREEHTAITEDRAKQPYLKVIKGGGAGAAAIAAGTWICDNPIRSGVTTTALAVTAAAAMWIGQPSEGITESPVPRKNVTAPPWAGIPHRGDLPRPSVDAMRVEDAIRPAGDVLPSGRGLEPAPIPGPGPPGDDHPAPTKQPAPDTDPPGPTDVDTPPGAEPVGRNLLCLHLEARPVRDIEVCL